MNQQRSRRFRASKETSEKVQEMDRIKTELEMRGAYVPPKKEKGEHFDSNCITPVRVYKMKSYFPSFLLFSSATCLPLKT